MKHSSFAIKSLFLVLGSWFLVLASLFLVSCRPDTTCRQTGMSNQLQFSTTDSTGSNKVFLLDMDAARTMLDYDLIRPTDSAQTVLHVLYHNGESQFVSLACGCRIAYKLDSVWTEDTLVAKAQIIDYDVPTFTNRGQQADNIEVLFP